MNILQRLRERFWFIPAVLCLTAFVVAEVLVNVDQHVGTLSLPGWLTAVLYRVGESGSRDILGAIASSSLAVAGTTFSITMAVLALTSSTYGPRLVRNFMTDRGNQTVLGVYVSTFLYSILVLRSIRVLGDPGNQKADVFVPHLAVNFAVVLAVADVVVLIYFIHHISDSIQMSTLASGVRSQLTEVVDRLYPAELGRDERDTEGTGPHGGLPVEVVERGVPVTAGRPGYLQSVRHEDLMEAAQEHDVVLALRAPPGQYVLGDTVLAIAHPPERVDDALLKTVRSAMELADARSPFQDVEFGVQQLTEMAVRALSPSTNDPYTAINALDDLSTGLARLASRDMPSAARYDPTGALRVHAPRPDVVELVTGVLDAIRWYAVTHPSVMQATLDLVERVGGHGDSPPLRAALAAQPRLLREPFGSAGPHEHDVERFDDHVDRVLRALHSG